MFKTAYKALALIALAVLALTTACVEDSTTCHDPEGFQGEFGCVYDTGDETGLSLEEKEESATRAVVEPRRELTGAERRAQEESREQYRKTWIDMGETPDTTNLSPGAVEGGQPGCGGRFMWCW